MRLSTYLRATGLFYRTIVPFSLFASVLVVGLIAPFGGLRLGVGLLFSKLVTFPVVWYLAEELRPHQYWLYLNLHVRPWQLWAGVVALDTLGFCGLIATFDHLTG